MARYRVQERKWVTNATQNGVGLTQKMLHRTHILVDTRTHRFMARGTEAECEKALLNLIATQPKESKDEQQ